jgi:hypothetical protein
LHEAEKVKLKAADFIKRNAAAVMAMEGWWELQLKHPELVQYIIIEISRNQWYNDSKGFELSVITLFDFFLLLFCSLLWNC